jgi:hypothetical protein
VSGNTLLIPFICRSAHAACALQWSIKELDSDAGAALGSEFRVVQVETGAVDMVQDARSFLQNMMHTVPAFLEAPSEPAQRQPHPAPPRKDPGTTGHSVAQVQEPGDKR